MLFNSLTFGVFFTVVFLIYWKVPNHYRKIFLLVTNYVFYLTWDIKFLIYLILITVMTYISGLIITNRNRKIVLLVNSLIIIGILVYMKYADILISFFVGNDLLKSNIITPIGISFYSFQALSYINDIYRNKVEPTKDFVLFATYLSFFPSLISGPIVRFEDFNREINRETSFDYFSASYGIKKMLIGYYKKIAVADMISIYVNKVYDLPMNYKGFDLLFASILYMIQIYCDFSGYSDIAIGTSKMLGISIRENFNSPYLANSIKEFWRRWHISLSEWFRDYVYIPLGGNRCSKVRKYINIMITFILSGMWHGSDFTYIIWGFVHGILQVIEDIFNSLLKRIKQNNIGKCISYVFVLVLLFYTWIIFRSNNINDLVYILKYMFYGLSNIGAYLTSSELLLTLSDFIKIGLIIIVVFIIDILNYYDDAISILSRQKSFIRWSIYVALIMIIIFNAPIINNGKFIYFNF